MVSSSNFTKKTDNPGCFSFARVFIPRRQSSYSIIFSNLSPKTHSFESSLKDFDSPRFITGKMADSSSPESPPPPPKDIPVPLSASDIPQEDSSMLEQAASNVSGSIIYGIKATQEAIRSWKISENVDILRRTSLGKNWKVSFGFSPVSDSLQPISSDPEVAVDASSNSANTPGGEERPASSGSPTSPAISDEKRKKYVEVRKYIMGELLQTEKNYVANLEIVLQNFKEPLLRSISDGSTSSNSSPNESKRGTGGLERSASVGASFLFHQQSKNSIVSPVDVKIIFAYIEELWQFSGVLCTDMENIVSKWEENEQIWEKPSDNDYNETMGSTLEDLFSHKARNWDIYLKFVDNYSAAKEAIRRNEESSAAYRQFMANCLKNAECQRQGISDFLILPIQRVTRYVLLLQDLKKHTPSDHPQYSRICSALDDMRKLANTVNEVKRKEEEMTRMFHVVRTVQDCPPTIISAQRRIIFENDLVDVSKVFASYACLTPTGFLSRSSPFYSNSNMEFEAVRMFIFNDLFMIAKNKKKRKDSSFSKKIMGVGTSSSNDSLSKKDKLSLHRIAWLTNLEIKDIQEEPLETRATSKASKSKSQHIVKITIVNPEITSDLDSRRKFYAELAKANTAAASSANISPRVSSKKRSLGETQKMQPLTTTSFQDLQQAVTAPSSPVSQSTNNDSAPPSPVSTLPSVEHIEQLARSRLQEKQKSPSSSPQSSPKSSGTPHPRSSSLATGNANLSSILKPVQNISDGISPSEHAKLTPPSRSILLKSAGTPPPAAKITAVTETATSAPPIIPSSSSHRAVTPENTESRSTVNSSPTLSRTSTISIPSKRESSLLLAQTNAISASIMPLYRANSESRLSSHRSDAGSDDGRSISSSKLSSSEIGSGLETFYFAFSDRKQKQDFLIVVNKLASDRQIRRLSIASVSSQPSS